MECHITNALLLGLMVLAASCGRPSREGLPYVGTVRVEAGDTSDEVIRKAANVVPTRRQLDAMDNGFIGFLHFGPNTFTGREWGTGFEDPAVFDLKELHTDEWCREMKGAGMKMAILTVKHHDGFCLWQTRYTGHGIMSTGYKDGKGDVLRELSESCRKYGLKLGIYLSPADLYQIESPDGLYGNLSEKTPRTIPRPVEGRPFENKTTFTFTVDDYNEYYLNQLFELLTEYGPISEVWLDGAHPKRKGGQTYDYAAWREVIRTLAPDAAVFGREDIRWCGNEAGDTRDAEFNVVTFDEDPAVMTSFEDMLGELGTREVYLSHERPFYLHYLPSETDTSIRDGWFFRNDDEQRVRTADEVFDIYERAVGGNSILLLNVPPNKEGRFSDRDIETLRGVGRLIDGTYGEGRDLLANARGPHKVLDGRQDTWTDADGLVIRLRKPVTINRIVLREPVAGTGERIESHAIDAKVDGEWKEIAVGTNVGFRRILRFPDVTTDAIRIRITASRAEPLLSAVEAYHCSGR
jgi:alpha-L-fucosidase